MSVMLCTGATFLKKHSCPVARIVSFDTAGLYLLTFRVCACVCVSVCVCVCLPANHLDVFRLGVKVDQGLPCVRHYIPRSSGKPL